MKISIFWVSHISKHMHKTLNDQTDPILPTQTFNNQCISISFQISIHSQLLYQSTHILPVRV